MTGFGPKTIVFLHVFSDTGSDLPVFDERVLPNEEPMVKTEGLLNVFNNLLIGPVRSWTFLMRGCYQMKNRWSKLNDSLTFLLILLYTPFGVGSGGRKIIIYRY